MLYWVEMEALHAPQKNGCFLKHFLEVDAATLTKGNKGRFCTLTIEYAKRKMQHIGTHCGKCGIINAGLWEGKSSL